MRQAKVYYKDQEAGLLSQRDDGSFVFQYHDHWLADIGKPAISLTLPKTRKSYRSDYLFPFFYNMLPEGTNKQAVCRSLRIDESDHFSLLLATASQDTIGAVTIKKILEPA